MAKPATDPEQTSASDEEELEDEDSSNLPPSKMKGDKPNPLRRWAETAGAY